MLFFFYLHRWVRLDFGQTHSWRTILPRCNQSRNRYCSLSHPQGNSTDPSCSQSVALPTQFSSQSSAFVHSLFVVPINPNQRYHCLHGLYSKYRKWLQDKYQWHLYHCQSSLLLTLYHSNQQDHIDRMS